MTTQTSPWFQPREWMPGNPEPCFEETLAVHPHLARTLNPPHPATVDPLDVAEALQAAVRTARGDQP